MVTPEDKPLEGETKGPPEPSKPAVPTPAPEAPPAPPTRARAIIVEYKYVSGDHEHFAKKLLELKGRSPAAAVHDYFKRFFGQGTVVESRCGVYLNETSTAGVAVVGWAAVEGGDVETLRKYGI